MKKYSLVLFSLVLLYSCGTEVKKEISDAERKVIDSLSKVNQKRKVDSMKVLNPLLILPPDSEFTGDYIDKYPNGIVKFKGFYRFGERHGQWIAFYENGLPWSEQHYDKGIKFGSNIVYFENGKTRYSGFYKGDKRDSLWMFFDSTGTLLKSIVFKEDKEVSQTIHKSR